MKAVAVTALGMICSAGYDVKTSCASIRAGIRRNADLPFEILDEESFETQQVTGYPVGNLFEGYQGVALLTKLAVKPLEDIMNYASLSVQDAHFWNQTGLMLCYSTSRDEAADLVDELTRRQLAALVIEHTGIPIPSAAIELFDQGNAAPLIALMRARQSLEKGALKRVIIVGMDSLVDEATVNRLADRGRLKMPELPCGLMPGEAAAAFMVEDINTARQRSAKIPAYVVGCDVQQGASFLDDPPRHGFALSEAMYNAVKRNKATQAEAISTIYGDLNGESARAMDWGNAMVKFRARVGYAPEHYVILAESIGDTGAASAVAGICAAIRAIERGYAKGNLQMVAAVSENGAVAAVLLAAKLTTSL